MIISIHPRKYDIERARADKDYGRFFAKGWQQLEVKRAADFAAVMTSRVWSPARLNGDRRCLEAFAGSRLLALDFETPDYTLAQAMREWCDTIHWIGTTRNHQREKGGITCDRFRLVVPWTAEITDPELYRYNYHLVGDAYGADLQCKDTARLFYPCQTVVSMNVEGEFQPVKPLPEGWLARRRHYEQRRELYARAGFIPLSVRRKLDQVVPTGKRNTTWYGFAKDLAPYGFESPRILELILGGATYRGVLASESLIREIQGCIDRGLRDGRRALAKLGGQPSRSRRSRNGQSDGYQKGAEKESW